GEARPTPAVDLRIFEVLQAAGCRRSIGERIILERVDGNGIEPLRWNEVARKRRSDKAAAVRSDGGWIIDDERTSRSVKALGKVPAPFKFGGNDRTRECRAPDLSPLEIEKVMSLVAPIVEARNPERSAERSTIGILLELTLGAADPVIEEVIGIQVVVAE